MAVTDGGYVMVTPAALSLALDVQRATSANGANVRLYSLNYSDGQLVQVTTYGAYQVIRFSMTGLVLDVQGARVAQGQNVQQHSWNKGKGQQWSIEATGNTYTVGGKTLPSYYVKSAINTGYELEAYGSSSSIASGTNLDIARHTADRDHEWLFVERPLLETSCPYKFLSAIDQNVCVGISGKAGDQQVRLAGVADDNGQLWAVADSSPDTEVGSFANSTWYLTPKGYATPANSTPVLALKAKMVNGSFHESQRWVPTIVGTTAFNGQQVPLVTLRNMLGTNQVLDVKGAASSVGTVLQTYTDNGGKSQKFLAIPETPLDDSLPAATSLLVADSAGGRGGADIWGRGTVTAYPCWVGDANEWDMRYRVRRRKATAGDDEFGAWGAWLNCANGSNAGLAWGPSGTATCITDGAKDPAGTTRRYAKGMPFEVSATGDDLIEVQYQMRRWGGWSSRLGAYTHGPQANATFRVKYQPRLAFEGATWSPDGMGLTYTSDQKRDHNEMLVYSIVCTDGDDVRHVVFEDVDGYPVTDLPWSGTAMVPQDRVAYIPDEGDAVEATVRWSNVDGAYLQERATYEGTVSYGGGRDLSVTLATEAPGAANGYMLHVSADVTDADSYSLFVDYDDGLGYRRFDGAGGAWDVPVLYERPYRAIATVLKGGRWAVARTEQFEAIPNPDAYIFNFVRPDGTRDWFAVKADVGAPPTYRRSFRADYDKRLTNGRNMPVVHFGYAQDTDGSVSGSYASSLGIEHAGVGYLRALLSGGYAWLRPPEDTSEFFRCAITGVDIDQTPARHAKVSVSYIIVDNPAG